MISTEDKLKDETPHFAKPVLSAGTGNLVELFAGSRSIGKVSDELGMNVFSVDWQNFEGINLAIDIGEMKTSDVPFIPDVVWASPDCTTYSIAACSTHRTNSIEPKSEYAKKCDQVNQHFIGLIKEWLKVNPNMVFFIENPRGMLRKMPFMQEFKRHTIWYCQYGDDRAKPTDIWTNSKDWQPRPICPNSRNSLATVFEYSQAINIFIFSFLRIKYRSLLCNHIHLPLLAPDMDSLHNLYHIADTPGILYLHPNPGKCNPMQILL